MNIPSPQSEPLVTAGEPLVEPHYSVVGRPVDADENGPLIFPVYPHFSSLSREYFRGVTDDVRERIIRLHKMAHPRLEDGTLDPSAGVSAQAISPLGMKGSYMIPLLPDKSLGLPRSE